MVSLEALIERSLLFGVAPVWLLAGFADFSCHRVMRIEWNAGLRESLLHLLMLAQLGIAALCPLFLALNASVLVLMLLACLAHEATTCVDLAYAESRREIPWFEQWVHGVQQAMPWAWLAGWMLVSAPQALALFGAGEAPAVWTIEARQPPLPPAYLAAFIGGAVVLVCGPFAYEAWRCWRAQATIPLAA